MTQNNVGIYASQISGHLYSGPYGAYDSLATTVLSTTASSVTFAGIPSGYKHLEVRLSGPTSDSAVSIQFRFNGDSGGNYTNHQIYADGSSVGANGSTGSSGAAVGMLSTSTGASIVSILDYSNANKYKTLRALAGYDANGSGYILIRSGVWMNTAAVTSMTLFPNSGTFNAYTKIALYGVK